MTIFYHPFLRASTFNACTKNMRGEKILCSTFQQMPSQGVSLETDGREDMKEGERQREGERDETQGGEVMVTY